MFKSIGANCTLGPQSLLPVLRDLAAAADDSAQRHAQCRFPTSRWATASSIRNPRPNISRCSRAKPPTLGVRIARRLLRHNARTHSRHGRSGEVAATSQRTRKSRSRRHRHAGRNKPDASPRASPKANSGKKSKRKNSRSRWKSIRPKASHRSHLRASGPRHGHSGKVDAIDINSGTLARVGMDALMLAGALEAHGFETIPHLTTRDANIIGLQAMLLGAWTIGGVRNVLAITGDPPSVGDHPETSGVYEVDSDRPGENYLAPESRHRLGRQNAWAAPRISPSAWRSIRWPKISTTRSDRFDAKIEAGAHFAMTQPVFDPEHWHAFLKKLGGKCPVPGAGRHLAANKLQAGPAPK